MSIQHLDGSDLVLSSNSTDVSYHAVRSYYSIYEQLRRQHPGLLLEICNDGGRMVDFGSAAHGDYFSITDSYDPLQCSKPTSKSGPRRTWRISSMNCAAA
jgi:alpha-galactosidase